MNLTLNILVKVASSSPILFVRDSDPSHHQDASNQFSTLKYVIDTGFDPHLRENSESTSKVFE